MNKIITVAVTLAALASVLPAPAAAQLTYKERERAEEIAKINARAQAQERAKTDAVEHQKDRALMRELAEKHDRDERSRRMSESQRRVNAREECSMENRYWDNVNDTCRPR